MGGVRIKRSRKTVPSRGESMAEEFHSSDIAILDLLRQADSLGVTGLAEQMQVTQTAIRQRLNRLMEQGYVQRVEVKQSRGRPTHNYSLTSSGRRKAGENFADLATALWAEVRSLEDEALKIRLIEGIGRRLARMYSDQVAGGTPEEKMAAIASIFGSRHIPMQVNSSSPGEMPVLSVLACPYPDLAEEDDAICHMERTLLSELVGEELELGECTVSGGNCCRFSSSSASTGETASQ